VVGASNPHPNPSEGANLPGGFYLLATASVAKLRIWTAPDGSRVVHLFHTNAQAVNRLTGLIPTIRWSEGNREV